MLLSRLRIDNSRLNMGDLDVSVSEGHQVIDERPHCEVLHRIMKS